MKKNNTKLFVAMVLLGSVVVSCQKKENITTTLPPQHQSLQTFTLARTDNKDYRIPMDTAKKWADRFKTLNETTFNSQMPGSLTIPVNGLEQLLHEAAKNNVKVAKIGVVFGVNKNAAVTAFYVPLDENGNPILNYENNLSGGNSTELYDGTEPCPTPGSCATYILDKPQD